MPLFGEHSSPYDEAVGAFYSLVGRTSFNIYCIGSASDLKSARFFRESDGGDGDERELGADLGYLRSCDERRVEGCQAVSVIDQKKAESSRPARGDARAQRTLSSFDA